MTYETILYSVKNRVLTLTLNRPDQLNAFTVTMANELIDAIERAGADDDVRAIIVTGSGKAFCAGMDLSVHGNAFGLDEGLRPTLQDVAENGDDPEIIRSVRDTGGRVTLAMYDCPKPIIAAINGAAVGIGATMTLAMDVRLMSSKGRIGLVFNKIGITPEAASTWFLPRIVGMSKALEWCYTAEILSAEKSLDSGLVTAVHDPSELLNAANELAHHIAENTSAVAIALTRQMMYRNAAAPHPRHAHNVDSLAIFYTSQTDAKEGIRAFLEKRPAEFKSRVSTDMPPFYPWWEK